MLGILESIGDYSKSLDTSFQKYTVCVAIVILIGTLSVMGVALYNASGSEIFPPSSGPCPDYWTVNDDETLCEHPDGAPTIDYLPGATICRKKQNLAVLSDAQLTGVEWDGVTNAYNVEC